MHIFVPKKCNRCRDFCNRCHRAIAESLDFTEFFALQIFLISST
nr:MAG TPA: defensin [Caudoviricetes sp.]